MNDKIGIIGLGYVGAPLAYLAAAKGYNVVGIDTDQSKIDYINKRLNVPKQLVNDYSLNKYSLKAFSNYSNIRDSSIIIICVPTPTLDNKPDLSILNSVVKSISNYLRNGCLLIVESTIAPGMTKKYVEDSLSKFNLILGTDYLLAYCPERIDPGNSHYWVGNINRVCGATSTDALNKAINFYSSIIDAKIISMNSIEEAELVKVWENSIRNVAIAQSNLLAMVCDKNNLSVKSVINGLRSKTEQFVPNITYPGIGPGGHCIPEDIHYLIDAIDMDVDASLFSESVKINEYMPFYAMNKLNTCIIDNGDSLTDLKILVLGISYKPNSKDTRKSQAKVLYDLLNNSNNLVSYFDPIVDGMDESLSVNVLDNELSKNDVIVIACCHDIFLNIDFSKYKNIKYVLDCWNKYDKSLLIKNNIKYIGIGE